MNLSEKDTNYIWHPFTQHQTAAPNIVITHGNAASLYDENGKEYIDAVSSWWTNLFGHANLEISNAIKNQLDQLEHVIFAGCTHQPAIDVAEALLKILPNNQNKIFFSDNGSTSVEVALKMAIQYWHNQQIEKNTIIAFKNAYHGDTFGAMAVGARGIFNQAFEPYLFDVEFIDLPTASNINHLSNQFLQIIQSKKVAAFIFEPLVQGSAGMLMYDAIFLDKLIAIAQQNNIICIADEVMTGFGRTGKNFASDYLQHKADIFCMSKGITGGFLPLGITSCTQKIYDAFLSSNKLKTFLHGHSYTANPLACAAANASLNLLSNAQDMINELVVWQSEMKANLLQHHKVENIRQTGTILAFEVKSNSSNSYFNNIRDALYDNFINRGILLRPLGNTVYVMPPYVITKTQLRQIYDVIIEVLDIV
ncbi:MAG TPA: adenosylmethionine--8-amino-7-oxononanoate transaminase [Chitinophagales bacterium]|nr:adenosylmethionine--8-amino-7-oxononanoate transaminase [Chitinophagales bacterium]